ncbi:MAG TPA: MlaD family protein [Caulobacteraceae bacterium]|jgi:phospholipid/cholesterol/gamma-HCH transport system substrate-binding protein
MERNANYALVGLISAIVFVGLVVFVVWLAGNGFSRSLDTYDILFKGPVRGLSKGAEVDFNGIKVGEVQRIYLDPKDATMVIAEARVSSDVPIRQDSIATLEPQGITGVNYVQISAGTPSKPLLKDVTPAGVTPIIQTRTDAFSSLLAGGGGIVLKVGETLDRVNQVLSDKNIQTIGTSLSNVKSLTDELAKRKAIIGDAQKTVQDADAAVNQFKDLAKSGDNLLNGNGKQTFAKLSDAATQIEAAAKSLKAMTDSLKGPTSRFATTALPQVSGAISSLRRATDQFNELVGEIRNNPRGFVAKPPAKQVEVKP